jgi:multiple sugar transport system ATP-binding protein
MARIDLIDICKTLVDRDRGVWDLASVAYGDSSSARGIPAGAAVFSMHNLNLHVPHGKTMVLLGPSGCGKSTLLRIVGGLIRPDSGSVHYDDADMTDAAPGDRRIGMVFQNYALYPHLNVRTNVLSYFWFHNRKPELDKHALAKYRRTCELMGVELTQLMDRRPRTLSGGEQQRVAVARCITREARLFLVDEPFANLDQALREKYRLNLKLLLQQLCITTIYVTHDQHEAMVLADLVAVMDRGRIQQVGTPMEVYDAPTNTFVADFLNPHGGAPPIGYVDARDMCWAAELGDARVGVRPEHVEVLDRERAGALVGYVDSALSVPPHEHTLLTIRVGAERVYARRPGLPTHRAGDRVWLGLRRYHVFDRATGQRLHSVGRAHEAPAAA